MALGAAEPESGPETPARSPRRPHGCQGPFLPRLLTFLTPRGRSLANEFCALASRFPCRGPLGPLPLLPLRPGSSGLSFAQPGAGLGGGKPLPEARPTSGHEASVAALAARPSTRAGSRVRPRGLDRGWARLAVLQGSACAGAEGPHAASRPE